MQVTASSDFRTEIRPGDLGAVIAFQGREYGEQYGLDFRFEAGVARAVTEFALAYARERFDTLELETFSELTTAAQMYKSVGFELRDTRPQNDWGREIQLQHYDLRF